jgi:hypothetical protein
MGYEGSPVERAPRPEVRVAGSRAVHTAGGLAILAFATRQEASALDTPSTEPTTVEVVQAEVPTPVDPATQA